MKTKLPLAKIFYCLSSFLSSLLFFCFLGKAYGSSPLSPSWYDLIFGGVRIDSSSLPLRRMIEYSPTPLGLILFSFTLLLTAFSLWLFVASISRKPSSILARYLALIHFALVALSCFLDLLSLPVYGSYEGLGSGSISYLACSLPFLLLDGLGMYFSFQRL